MRLDALAIGRGRDVLGQPDDLVTVANDVVRVPTRLIGECVDVDASTLESLSFLLWLRGHQGSEGADSHESLSSEEADPDRVVPGALRLDADGWIHDQNLLAAGRHEDALAPVGETGLGRPQGDAARSALQFAGVASRCLLGELSLTGDCPFGPLEVRESGVVSQLVRGVRRSLGG
ncbi:MAG: hypothetical protein QM765_19710 [Myxococcales bacterium]